MNQMDELLTRKLELMLEMNAKRMLAEMQGLKEQVGSLQEEIIALRRQLNRPMAAAVPSAPISAPAGASSALAAEQAPPAQPSATAPRGNNLPSNLSIDKIFYCGQK